MKHRIYIIFILVFGHFLAKSEPEPPVWGFFGHKRINRLAVFTLPPEMIVFYKKNIEYITDHAVDPDKRRYAVKQEAPRHYIDLDRYEKPEDLPKSFIDALCKFTEIYVVDHNNDTILISDQHTTVIEKRYVSFSGAGLKKAFQKDSIRIDKYPYRRYISNVIERNLGDKYYPITLDTLFGFLPKSNLKFAFAKEILTEHGIVPWHLQTMQRRLTEAFKQQDFEKILRLSAEIGHYIGDAHVPLHTTQNYNGQLTDQAGIHGFWESRIPELFADDTYDFFVGKADYIANPQQKYWKTVMDSHTFVDSVLLIEKRLSRTFPSDQQFCYDERMSQNVRQPCRAYAQAYSDAMQGQVEARMRAAIQTVGDAWYTAWIDAGQPDLKPMMLKMAGSKEDETAEKAIKDGNGMIGRGEN
jgi:hypothetical protein